MIYLTFCVFLQPAVEEDDDDSDVDLFGSDDEEEDAEAAKIREERLAAYAAKKSKKPALIAKSNIIFDVSHDVVSRFMISQMFMP